MGIRTLTRDTPSLRSGPGDLGPGWPCRGPGFATIRARGTGQGFVTSVSGVPGGGGTDPEVARDQGRHAQARQPRARQARVKQAELLTAGRPAAEGRPFGRRRGDGPAGAAGGLRGERFGQPIAVLLAGAVTAAGDLGAASLRAGPGADLSLGLVDDDQPVTRAAVGSHPDLDRCTLGDLRTVPLPQRSFDIVQATLLLEPMSTPNWCSTGWSARSSRAACCACRSVTGVRPGFLDPGPARRGPADDLA